MKMQINVGTWEHGTLGSGGLMVWLYITDIFQPKQLHDCTFLRCGTDKFRHLSYHHVHATLLSRKLRTPLQNTRLGYEAKILNNVCVAWTVSLTMGHDNRGWAGDPGSSALPGCA